MKKIKETKYHYITRDGRVLSDFGGGLKELKQQTSKKGYKKITLSGKTQFTHRLVAINFIPNPNSYPQVNHINGDKSDNNVKNLEWVTNQQNQIHAWENGLIKPIPAINRVLSEQDAKKIRDEYKLGGTSHRKLAEKYNVSKTTIGDLLRGKNYNIKKEHEPIVRNKNERELSYVDANKIRLLYETGDYSYNKLGKMYGVDHKTIKRITDYISYI